MKTVIVCIVSAALGCAIGAAAINHHLQKQLAAEKNALEQASEHAEEMARLIEERKSLDKPISPDVGKPRSPMAMESVREIQSLREEVARLKYELASKPGRSASVTPILPAAKPKPSNTKQEEPAVEPTVEERQAQVVRVREKVQRFYQDLIDRTHDPDRQERLKLIAEQADFGIELRARLNEAETPEESAQLQQDLRITFMNHDQLVRDFRAAELISLAERNGVDDPRTFVRDANSVISGPLFPPYAPLAGGRNLRIETADTAID